MGGLFSKNKKIKFYSNDKITEPTEVKYLFISTEPYKLKIDMNVNLIESSDLTIKIKNEKSNFTQNLYFTKSEVVLNTDLGNYPYIFEGETEVIIQFKTNQSLLIKKLSIEQMFLEKSNFGSSGNNNYLILLILIILLLCFKQMVK